MSLQVWLPLNGNLNNNGVANVTITNNGATVNADGKIGSCYYFNGSSQIKITLPSTMTTIKNTSVCAFVKSTSSVLALGGISQDQSNTTACMTLYTSGWQFTGSSAYKYVSGGTIANTAVWRHVCCVMTDTDITTYLDGVQIKNVTIANAGVTNFDLTSSHFIEIGQDSPGSDEKLTGYVNDFRIYDHALSPKEVKEISKGLILHLPLDNNGLGNPNIIDTSVDTTGNTLTGWEGNQNVTFSNVYQDGSYRIKCQSAQTTSTPGMKCSVTGLTANTDYTVSCYVQTSGTSVALYTWKKSNNSALLGTSYVQYPTEEKVTLTFNSGSETSIWIFLFMSGVTTSSYILARDFKLEVGTTASIYSPNIAIENAIYDTSGFCNNGTKTGEVSADINSPRYNSASKFISSSYISVPIPAISNFNVYTFSWWGKTSEYSNNKMFWGFSNGNRLNLYGTEGVYCWNTGDSANNKFGTTSVAGESDNNWHHFAVTGDGTTVKLYIDGIFKANAKTFRPITGTTICINGWDAGTTYKFNGSLSDYRLYTTCLSADNIAELYKVPISIDNTGKVHAIEFNEV